jgi:hypothetical protein
MVRRFTYSAGVPRFRTENSVCHRPLAASPFAAKQRLPLVDAELAVASARPNRHNCCGNPSKRQRQHHVELNNNNYYAGMRNVNYRANCVQETEQTISTVHLNLTRDPMERKEKEKRRQIQGRQQRSGTPDPWPQPVCISVMSRFMDHTKKREAYFGTREIMSFTVCSKG